MIANHLWQSTAFAAAAALLALALRGNHARTRHWVWLAASLKFLVPFAILTALGSQAGSRTAVRPIATAPVVLQLEALADPVQWSAPGGLPGGARSSLLPDLALALWACGTLLVAARWWNRWRAMRAVVRGARPCDVEFPIPVRTSAAAIEPGIFGIFRPVLLLPEGIAERLTPAQLRAILAHELCHARRRDNLWAAAHMLVEALFWFHPLVWWIGARLVEERERACDEEVVASSGEPEAYAEGILAACKLYLESPLACVAGVGGGNLRRRIERIMGAWAPRELSAAGKTMIGVAAALAVTIPVAVGFLRAPAVRAQSSEAASVPAVSYVASIKPNRSVDTPTTFDYFPQSGRFHAVNVPVRPLIWLAYGIQRHQLNGAPTWLSADRYDIEAKVEGNPPTNRVFLQRLLADRFGLLVHTETRELPQFTLVLARKDGRLGPRLKRADFDCAAYFASPHAPPDPAHMPPCVTIGNIGSISGRSITMAQLVANLSGALGRSITDQTGLDGRFDAGLTWTPDTAPPNGTDGSTPVPAFGDFVGPSISTAVEEQLGLKLLPTRGPVEIVVIDHVERPSEN